MLIVRSIILLTTIQLLSKTHGNMCFSCTKKDLRRGPLIENPSKHRLHNAATVKEYLFPPVTMIHCLKPTVNYQFKKI